MKEIVFNTKEVQLELNKANEFVYRGVLYVTTHWNMLHVINVIQTCSCPRIAITCLAVDVILEPE